MPDAGLEMYKSANLLQMLELMLRGREYPIDYFDVPEQDSYSNYFCKDPKVGIKLLLPDTLNVRMFVEMAVSVSKSPWEMRGHIWCGCNTDPVVMLTPKEAFKLYVEHKKANKSRKVSVVRE